MDIAHMVSALNKVSRNLRHTTITIPLDGYSTDLIQTVTTNTPRRSVSFLAKGSVQGLLLDCSGGPSPPTLSRSPECKKLPIVRRPSTPVPFRTGIHPRTIHIAPVSAV